MGYDKGQQITVGRLKKFLSYIPDDTKVFVGIGDNYAPVHYLLNYDGNLVLHPDCYMIDAEENNFLTVLSFNTKKT